MSGLFVFALIIVLTAIVFVVFGKKKSSKTSDCSDQKDKIESFYCPEQKGKDKSFDYPYQKIGVLFSPAERSFIGVLNKVVDENIMVFGKVRVADVMTPQKGLSRKKWQRAFNKISGKHFDFLLCNNNDLSVICAIELDDNSHQKSNRQKRDKFLQGACVAAELPLIQIPARRSYVLDEVKQLLAPHLVAETMNENIQQMISEEEISPIEKKCPKCSSPMVKRIAKKGSNAGNEFWACSAFPRCRYVNTIPLEPIKKNFNDLKLNLNVTEKDQVNPTEYKTKDDDTRWMPPEMRV